MAPRSGSGWEQVYHLPLCRSSHMSGESAAVTVLASAYGMPNSQVAPLRGIGSVVVGLQPQGWDHHVRVV